MPLPVRSSRGSSPNRPPHASGQPPAACAPGRAQPGLPGPRAPPVRPEGSPAEGIPLATEATTRRDPVTLRARCPGGLHLDAHRRRGENWTQQTSDFAPTLCSPASSTRRGRPARRRPAHARPRAGPASKTSADHLLRRARRTPPTDAARPACSTRPGSPPGRARSARTPTRLPALLLAENARARAAPAFT